MILARALATLNLAINHVDGNDDDLGSALWDPAAGVRGKGT